MILFLATKDCLQPWAVVAAAEAEEEPRPEAGARFLKIKYKKSVLDIFLFFLGVLDVLAKKMESFVEYLIAVRYSNGQYKKSNGLG